MKSSGMQRIVSDALSISAFLFFLMTGSPSFAQPPPNYYIDADSTSGTALRASIHGIIDDHKRFPYTSNLTDTWDVVNRADQDPSNTLHVLTIYKNASYQKIEGGRGSYNREHLWPKSYGFPEDTSGNYPYTDLHHLVAADASYNSSRGNLPFGACTIGCKSKDVSVKHQRPTGETQGRGEANWRSGSGASGIWEVWNERKGDVARAMFYMAVRYEGGKHSITGVNEPDLELTDDENLIRESNTGKNEKRGFMGRLSILLSWHYSDPVDDIERRRNDVVFEYQGNRNPFIDNPHWVGYIFE